MQLKKSLGHMMILRASGFVPAPLPSFTPLAKP